MEPRRVRTFGVVTALMFAATAVVLVACRPPACGARPGDRENRPLEGPLVQQLIEALDGTRTEVIVTATERGDTWWLENYEL